LSAEIANAIRVENSLDGVLGCEIVARALAVSLDFDFPEVEPAGLEFDIITTLRVEVRNFVNESLLVILSVVGVVQPHPA